MYSLKTCKHISEEFTHRFHVAENSMVRAKKKKKIVSLSTVVTFLTLFLQLTLLHTVKTTTLSLVKVVCFC